MTLFIVIAALLLIAILAALLYPLLRQGGQPAEAVAGARELSLTVLREQRAELERDLEAGVIDASAYEKGRIELERRALEDVGQSPTVAAVNLGRRPMVAGLIGVLLPATVIPLYFYLGEPAALGGGKPAATANAGSHAVTAEQIAGMVQKLAERLQENPNDGPGWLMLARSYGAMGRYAESAAAYNRATILLPPDAQTLADFADTVAMAQGRSLRGEPEKLIQRALMADPNNLKALALSGTIAFDRQDYAAAIADWRKILTLVPPDSNVAAGIQNSIRDAENRMALVGQTGGDSSAKAAPTATVGVSGTVKLDGALASSVVPGDTVYIFARAVDGPKVPLAMMKKTVADLPLEFTLDDSMSMAPNFKLSQHKTVVIGARVSKTGDAMPRPGDLEGLSAPVPTGETSVRIIINKKVG